MGWFWNKLNTVFEIESYPFFELELDDEGYVVCSLCQFGHSKSAQGNTNSKVVKNKTFVLFTCVECQGTYCYKIANNNCVVKSNTEPSMEEDIEERVEYFRRLEAYQKDQHDKERLTILEKKVEELYLLLDKFKISRY
jgi:hypothetical protein